VPGGEVDQPCKVAAAWRAPAGGCADQHVPVRAADKSAHCPGNARHAQRRQPAGPASGADGEPVEAPGTGTMEAGDSGRHIRLVAAGLATAAKSWSGLGGRKDAATRPVAERQMFSTVPRGRCR
jgi:hypothetical protein